MRKTLFLAAFVALLIGSLGELLSDTESTTVSRESVRATALSEVDPPTQDGLKTKFFFPQKPEQAQDRQD